MTDNDRRSDCLAGEFEELERERAELKREAAEQIAQDKRLAEYARTAARDELLQWALDRETERRRAEHQASLPKRAAPAVAKDYNRDMYAARSAPAPAAVTADWQRYIEARLDARIATERQAMIGGIADYLFKVEVRIEKLEAALADQRETVQRLELELAEARGGKRLRAVTTADQASMIA